jgi:hypothetical protein
MMEHGVAVGHADPPGKYREVDTQQDMDLARPCGGPEVAARPLPLFPASTLGSMPRPADSA